MDSLDGLREQIAEKDMGIARLISERTELAKNVGRIKIGNGMPIRDIEAEKKVFARYSKFGAENGLSSDCMKDVASAVIREAVDSESRLCVNNESKRIAVIGGAGKMGKWTADLMEASGHSVIVIDPACANGNSIEDCGNCDVVVISVPIHLTGGILEQLESICGKNTLIFDLTSLKTPVEEKLRSMASGMKVCSVHPMFGPSAESIFGRNFIICDCGNQDAVKETADLFDDRGGNIRIMDISEHDNYMSYVLGLTHAVNIALFTVLDRSGLSFGDLQTVASTTFNKGLDTNRSVALEDPMLYYEIQHMNSHRDEMWSLFSDAVNDLMEASLSDDPSKFRELMDRGREYFSNEVPKI